MSLRDHGHPPRWHPAKFDLLRTTVGAISTTPWRCYAPLLRRGTLSTVTHPVERSRRPRRGAPARPQPRFHDHVDALGVRSPLRAPWRRSDQESVGLARRPDPGRTPLATPTGPLLSSPRSRRPRAHRDGRVGGTTGPPGLRGRPSPTAAHARWRRDRHRREPTHLSGGPDHQQRVTTGQLPRSPPGMLAPGSGRQDEHLATRPPRRQFCNPAAPYRSAQRAARPRASRW
jgi:hypothetical protein